MTTVRKAPFAFGLLALCILVPACHHGPRPTDLLSPVRDLTRAVQTEAFDAAHQIPEDRLVAEVFAKRSDLKQAFGDLKIDIRIFSTDEEVVVLVHSPDGNHCWFEDGSWTSNIDRICYDKRPLPPAQFTLVPPRVASRPGSASRPTSAAAQGP